MSKSKGKGGKKWKALSQPKDPSAIQDPMNCQVNQLVLMIRQSGQSYEKVSLNEHFVQQAEELYPGLATRTITVPAIHVSKFKREKQNSTSNLLGYDTFTQPTESDVRGDKAHIIVFHALHDLSEKLLLKGLTPLFMVNSYHYDSYLCRLKARWEKENQELASCQEASGEEQVARDIPVNLPQQSGEKRGEVDMLVLQPGRVAFIQAKSMGDNFHQWPEDMLKAKEEKIMKEIREAFKQLDRDDNVFEVCMSEFYQEFNVFKIAAFPNLTWKQIVEAHEKEPQILESAGYSLDLQNHNILCKDHLPDREGHSQDVTSLFAWWLKHVENQPDDSYESEEDLQDSRAAECEAECDQKPVEGLDILKNVVGRYLGIMSIVAINCRSAAKGSYVELRRPGQAVKYVSDEYSSITLTLEQVEMINSDVRLGFLTGPPGSGKTVVLAIKARSWIIQKQNFVVNINMYRGACGRAIGKQTIKIITMHKNKDRLKKLKAQCYELCIDVNDFDENERQKKIKEILNHFKLKDEERHRVMFLVDETYVMPYWKNVFKMLVEDFKDSPVWLAGLYGNMPSGFTSLRLTKVIRCPGMVEGLLKHVDWIDDRRKHYLSESSRMTGTYVLAIRHRNHSEPSLHPTQCRDCAEDMILLLDKFNVSKPGTSESQPADLKNNSLECRDVCILLNLPRVLYQSDDKFLDTSKKCYETYMKSLENCPFFDTLRRQNYPVKLHINLPCRELVDDNETGEGAQNVIKACWVFSFQGLENRVVFYLPGDPAVPENVDQLPEEQRKILTDPWVNIPCPGYRTKNTEKFDMNVGKSGHNVDGAVALKRSQNEKGLGRRGSVDLGQKYTEEDIDRFTRWDKSTLFISASRSTGQLVLITP